MWCSGAAPLKAIKNFQITTFRWQLQHLHLCFRVSADVTSKTHTWECLERGLLFWTQQILVMHAWCIHTWWYKPFHWMLLFKPINFVGDYCRLQIQMNKMKTLMWTRSVHTSLLFIYLCSVVGLTHIAVNHSSFIHRSQVRLHTWKTRNDIASFIVY